MSKKKLSDSPKRTRALPPKKPPPPVHQAEPDTPHWLIDDGCWIKMPENMRQLVSRIITPAYRQFVLEARDELERSVGMTLVHQMWLEIGKAVSDNQSVQAILNNPEELIERHLRLTAAKCQTAELLLKLRTIDDMMRHPSFSAGAAPLLPEPLTGEISPPHGSHSFSPRALSQKAEGA